MQQPKARTARLLVGVLGVLLSHGAARAGTLDVSFVPGALNLTTALTGFSTLGDMMDGMSVTAFFEVGGPETVFWADTGAGAGAALGTGWSLSQTGDTFVSPWTLANATGTGLLGLLIDAGVGDTVFDVDFAPFPGTDGSADGNTFELTAGGDPYDIDVTYSDRVALIGDPPVGDLWRRLRIVFDGAALRSGDSISYLADTDNLSLAGDIREVPEPGTIALLGFGVAFVARRRRRA